jgi:hypothetical protein
MMTTNFGSCKPLRQGVSEAPAARRIMIVAMA